MPIAGFYFTAVEASYFTGDLVHSWVVGAHCLPICFSVSILETGNLEGSNPGNIMKRQAEQGNQTGGE